MNTNSDTHADPFVRLPLSIDEAGNIWAANGDGIICFTEDGRPYIDDGYRELIVACVNGWNELVGLLADVLPYVPEYFDRKHGYTARFQELNNPHLSEVGAHP